MILRNGISEKTIDLVNEDKLLRMNNMSLGILFDAIRKQNNRFVLNHLATKENKQKLAERAEKERGRVCTYNNKGDFQGCRYAN